MRGTPASDTGLMNPSASAKAVNEISKTGINDPKQGRQSAGHAFGRNMRMSVPSFFRNW